jgi:hypothetical protein
MFRRSSMTSFVLTKEEINLSMAGIVRYRTGNQAFNISTVPVHIFLSLLRK